MARITEKNDYVGATGLKRRLSASAVSWLLRWVTLKKEERGRVLRRTLGLHVTPSCRYTDLKDYTGR